tara:strand:+ start:6604 stop:6897 length:294 start_codon:yes stop_codon:yes gene_type:complete
MTPRAKRNDIIAVQLNYGNEYHYFLAKATSVSRDGLVKKYIKSNGATYKTNGFTHVMVISNPEHQGAARELFTFSALDFVGLEQIKEAILDRAKNLQ